MKTDQGLTLLEVLAAVVLLSLLAAAVTPLMRDALRASAPVPVDVPATSAEEQDPEAGTQEGEPILLERGDALQGTWRVFSRDGVLLCRWFPEEEPEKKQAGRRPR
ncbi:MAG: prepilin-type N-terminal cleavage/methylation domain-containing protein [Planctomycetes bacterium]|nr:prepilin-type N-terminal cleavage/methylation domain-containing protein [Planctomycetota bacterium]